MRKLTKIKTNELRFLKPAIEKHPNNKTQLEFLIKQNAVAALLLNADASKVFLVKQYRPGVGKEIYEIPAGLIEEKEDPKLACFREVEEETGYLASNYKVLYEARNPLFVSPGYTEEALYFYVFQLHSDTVSPQPLHLDEGEELVGAWFSINEIFSNHRPHISYDLKTVFCFLLWKSLKS
ncbi:MAG: NUDIX hydrolase [Fusobacterium necrophorum]|nr:NUDIX hydrolase [Fusobacterium necrophorum]